MTQRNPGLEPASLLASSALRNLSRTCYIQTLRNTTSSHALR